MGTVLGAVSVASSPSPYFAALGLVAMAGTACILLWLCGASFHSLILLLIYLGGILVVFAYCAALAAEPFPEAWGQWTVFGNAVLYLVLVISIISWLVELNGEADWFTVGGMSMETVWVDISGVGIIYSSGGGLLALAGWILFITLFVVIHVTWGRSRGALRKI